MTYADLIGHVDNWLQLAYTLILVYLAFTGRKLKKQGEVNHTEIKKVQVKQDTVREVARESTDRLVEAFKEGPNGGK